MTVEIPRLYIQEQLPDGLDEQLVARDVALWVGRHPTGSAGQAVFDAITDLVALPWNLILVEDASAEHAALFAGDQRMRSRGVRGHRIPVAGPVSDVSFPEQSIPVLFLNGREDGDSAAERPDAGGANKQLLRRLGMLEELGQRAVRTVVLVPAPTDDLNQALSATVAELRPHIVVLSPSDAQMAVLRSWAEQRPGPISVTVCTSPLSELARTLSEHITRRVPSDRLRLRVRLQPEGSPTVVDCSEFIPSDSPALALFNVLRDSDLSPVSEDALTPDEIDGFFSRTTDESSESFWRPYAAGLPWPRDEGASVSRLLERLEKVRASAPGTVSIVTVDTEPGAGGTTASRILAFQAARTGYPTLVARAGVELAPPEVASAFFFSVSNVVRQPVVAAPGDGEHAESAPPEEGGGPIPWLLVLDTEHWINAEEVVLSYARVFKRFAHRVVIMLVRETTSRGELQLSAQKLFDAPLAHELSQPAVESLGQHLNRYLRHIGREQSIAQWQSFWADNSLVPEPGTLGVPETSSSFWVALEFWLRKQLSLGESIRRWLYARFAAAEYRGSSLAVETKRVLLTIAALSLERTHLPEQLLPLPAQNEDPLSAQLSSLLVEVPAIGLIRRRTDRTSVWGIAHLPLAQHLLDAASEDPDLLSQIGVAPGTTSVRLRIRLLAEFAKNEALGQERYRPLALRFAQSIFKLERTGHQEFARYWRDVLNALFGMSEVLWDTSRAFIHHVAISRRRVAVDDDLFADKSESERARLLEEAVGDLEYALSLDKGEDDERDLNILNSLARACQDFAAYLRRTGGDTARITALENREIECLQQAEQLNPTNSHVLETSARGYILAAQRDPDSAARSLCAALQRISTARSLDSAAERRQRLDELTQQAFEGLMRLSDGDLEKLRTTNPSVAAMSAAWRLLRRVDDSGMLLIADTPGADVARAIDVLEAVPPKQREWVLTRLLYDLVALQHPYDFARQLQLLRALEGTPAMHLQLKLERAILLHQTGSHPTAEHEFRDIRRELQDSEAIIDVPKRLSWFLKTGSADRAVCDGKVVQPPGNWRRHAMRVVQLGNTIIGFDPLDFGVDRMPLGRVMKCVVGFNVRGPYARPVPNV